jgi:PilZ domain-containing protein
MRLEREENDETAQERRRTTRRRHLEDHGIREARVRSGSDAAVIDVSAGGALIETPRRLLPGAAIELQLISEAGRVAVRGRVLRCAVWRIRPGSIWYRGAVAFDRHLQWFVEDGVEDGGTNSGGGYGVPGGETRAGRHRREQATPHVA